MIFRLDAINIWKNREVKERLNWYYKVLKNEVKAKYLIVKSIELKENLNLKELEEKELWKIHSELRNEFLDKFEKMKNGKNIEIKEIDKNNNNKNNFLDVKIELAYRMLSPCKFCENLCLAKRLEGEKGKCGLDNITRVASAFLHYGEEAPLIPSGTIFFTGCSFKCVYCQNWDISQNPKNGFEVNSLQLAEIEKELYDKGAININFVGGNPDQNLHTILESLKYFNENIALLWNSNMYMTKESLELLLDVIDIWLPDFKYGNDSCAYKYSKIKNYFEIVSRNHKIIYDFGENIIVRHLVLPNHLECCTYKVLDWISKNIPNVLVNIMDQYHPEYLVLKFPEKFDEIARRLNYEEIKKAYEYAKSKNICFEAIS
ncbi:MAG: radical SAM protein [Candidatus Aenigmatarchaeota archaeon]